MTSYHHNPAADPWHKDDMVARGNCGKKAGLQSPNSALEEPLRRASAEEPPLSEANCGLGVAAQVVIVSPPCYIDRRLDRKQNMGRLFLDRPEVAVKKKSGGRWRLVLEDGSRRSRDKQSIGRAVVSSGEHRAREPSRQRLALLVAKPPPLASPHASSEACGRHPRHFERPRVTVEATSGE